MLRARCDCGAVEDLSIARFRSGRPCKECRQRFGPRHELYFTWKGMKRRCSPRSHLDATWRRYGGRGIRVCEAWRESFRIFLRDMGPRPSPDHTLNRIDNDGNYQPGNVEWVPHSDPRQTRNRRDNRLLTFDGETHTLTDWAEATGLKANTIRSRLERGWDVERALLEPLFRPKLTAGQVVALRYHAAELGNAAAVAEEAGLPYFMVSDAVMGRTWKNVGGPLHVWDRTKSRRHMKWQR